MKLLRHGENGREKPGIVDGNGRIRDLSGVIDDVAGDVLSPEGLEGLRRHDIDSLPSVAESTRLGPCVGRIGKVIGVGLNYSDHAAEAGMELPKEPILFMKATSSICGANDDVILPRGSKKTDWEVELGVVIGTPARYVAETAALDYVAGYCVVNDVSERSYQLERGGQWVKGKSADSFAPIGPWLVTADEVPDPQALDLWLELNGERHQNSSTSKMVFGVRKLVSYISEFMTLMPGDVIATGTPAGVGMGLKPQRFLVPGDSMRLGVAGLGEQKQVVRA